MKSVSRVHYAMKANPHADLLRTLHAEGIHFECVSRGRSEACARFGAGHR